MAIYFDSCHRVPLLDSARFGSDCPRARQGFRFRGGATCAGRREEPAEDGGGTRRGGAAAGAAGPDGGVRSGAAHGHRRLLPHLGPPVQRPLLHRRRPRGAPVRPQTFSPPTSFNFLNLLYSVITEKKKKESDHL